MITPNLIDVFFKICNYSTSTIPRALDQDNILELLYYYFITSKINEKLQDSIVHIRSDRQANPTTYRLTNVRVIYTARLARDMFELIGTLEPLNKDGSGESPTFMTHIELNEFIVQAMYISDRTDTTPRVGVVVPGYFPDTSELNSLLEAITDAQVLIRDTVYRSVTEDDRSVRALSQGSIVYRSGVRNFINASAEVIETGLTVVENGMLLDCLLRSCSTGKYFHAFSGNTVDYKEWSESVSRGRGYRPDVLTDDETAFIDTAKGWLIDTFKDHDRAH